eukprot:684511-Rhodomonas_salina.3
MLLAHSEFVVTLVLTLARVGGRKQQAHVHHEEIEKREALHQQERENRVSFPTLNRRNPSQSSTTEQHAPPTCLRPTSHASTSLKHDVKQKRKPHA